jgi:hypothetical protein
MKPSLELRRVNERKFMALTQILIAAFLYCQTPDLPSPTRECKDRVRDCVLKEVEKSKYSINERVVIKECLKR